MRSTEENWRYSETTTVPWLVEERGGALQIIEMNATVHWRCPAGWTYSETIVPLCYGGAPRIGHALRPYCYCALKVPRRLDIQ